MSRAAINGQRSRGKTLLSIFRKAPKNDKSAWGSTKGKSKGTAMAAKILDSRVYVVSADTLPPSFPVMTAAAVAVGHIRQTMAPSNISL